MIKADKWNNVVVEDAKYRNLSLEKKYLIYFKTYFLNLNSLFWSNFS